MSAKLEVLERARAFIDDKDNWVQGVFQSEAEDGGLRRCAVQAWRDALMESEPMYGRPERRRMMVPTIEWAEDFGYTLLTKACDDLWGTSDLMSVNDVNGWEAVMDVYDRAIKEARIEDEPPDPVVDAKSGATND